TTLNRSRTMLHMTAVWSVRLPCFPRKALHRSKGINRPTRLPQRFREPRCRNRVRWPRKEQHTRTPERRSDRPTEFHHPPRNYSPSTRTDFPASRPIRSSLLRNDQRDEVVIRGVTRFT